MDDRRRQRLAHSIGNGSWSGCQKKHRDPSYASLRAYTQSVTDAPIHIDLKKDRGLTIEWADGSASYYSIAYLRRNSPSAESRELRKELEANPLAVLPSSAVAADTLIALDAELVGNYAIRIHFSDGHATGIYSWRYLREIDPAHSTQDQGETT